MDDVKEHSPVTARRGSGPVVLRVAVLAGALAALGTLAWFVLRTANGQRADEAAMVSVVAGRDTQLTVLSLLGYVSIGAVAVVAILCVGLALVRGRVAAGVAALVVLAGANVTTQLLKHAVLQRIDGVVVAPNSFPSGHTTVVVACVGALVIAVPRSLRPAVVLGGTFAVTLTGAATVVAGWHRPSDVVGAVLIALIWTAAAALVLGGPTDRGRAAWVGAPIGAAAGAIVLVAIGVRPSYGWSGFGDAALTLGLTTLAVALATALMNLVASDDRRTLRQG